MNKFVMGIAFGTAIGYVVSKMQEQGYFDEMYDQMHDFASKTRRKARHIMDEGADELESIKDRVACKVKEGKEKLNAVKR